MKVLFVSFSCHHSWYNLFKISQVFFSSNCWKSLEKVQKLSVRFSHEFSFEIFPKIFQCYIISDHFIIFPFILFSVTNLNWDHLKTTHKNISKSQLNWSSLIVLEIKSFTSSRHVTVSDITEKFHKKEIKNSYTIWFRFSLQNKFFVTFLVFKIKNFL